VIGSLPGHNSGIRQALRRFFNRADLLRRADYPVAVSQDDVEPLTKPARNRRLAASIKDRDADSGPRSTIDIFPAGW
jgi:hypothetical protein